MTLLNSSCKYKRSTILDISTANICWHGFYYFIKRERTAELLLDCIISPSQFFGQRTRRRAVTKESIAYHTFKPRQQIHSTHALKWVSTVTPKDSTKSSICPSLWVVLLTCCIKPNELMSSMNSLSIGREGQS